METTIPLITVGETADAAIILDACRVHFGSAWTFESQKTELGERVIAKRESRKLTNKTESVIWLNMLPAFAQGVYAGILGERHTNPAWAAKAAEH